MTKSCPSCGAAAPAEARFCRHCGTALRATTGQAASDTVSPLANTEPLAGQPFTTGELAAPQSNASAALSASDAATMVDLSAAHVEGDSGEITISVVRPERAEAHTTSAAPAPTQTQQPAAVSSNTFAAPAQASGALPAQVGPTPTPRQTPERRALRLWLAGGVIIGALSLCVLAAGAWYMWRMRHEPAPVAHENAPPPAPTDARQQAQAKVAEAQGLLSAGDPIGATARLREAIALDPTNAEAHRQLAQLLLESGARQTAIEELRALTSLEPNDKDAWRQLAAAQFAAGLYADAAESYHTLMNISNEALTDDRLQLAYADALRLAGRADEANALYRRLATSPLVDVARASKQRLTNASAPLDETNANVAPHEDGKATNAPTPTTLPARASASPTPPTPAGNPSALTGSEHYQRGVSLWATNRAAAVTEFHAAVATDGNPDAYYYLGLNFAEGRDPRALGRAELVAALEFFQRARAGHFSAQARRYEDQLGQEFDRRRAQKQ